MFDAVVFRDMHRTQCSVVHIRHEELPTTGTHTRHASGEVLADVWHDVVEAAAARDAVMMSNETRHHTDIDTTEA